MSASDSTLPTTGTSLLDLDTPVLSLIAEKGVHRELRSTCKALQQICDSCRTRLLIKNLASAENSLMSLSRWPSLTFFGFSINKCPNGPESDRLNELLTAISGRQLRCLDLHISYSGLGDGLLALVLRGCRTTLRTLKLSGFEIRGGLQKFSSELWKCKLKSLSILGVGCRNSSLWSTKLVSGTLGSHLQELEVDLLERSEGTVQEWQEAGKCLKNLISLSLRSCAQSFLKDSLGGFLAHCIQLRKLNIEWKETDDSDSESEWVGLVDSGLNLEPDAESSGVLCAGVHQRDNVFFAAAAHCPHLESLAMDRCVSPAALVALAAGRCQALRHLKVCVNVQGLSNMDELRNGLSSLTSVEHLELAFNGRVKAQSTELLEAVESGLLAMRKLRDLNLFRRPPSPSLALVVDVDSFIWALPEFKVLHCDVEGEDADMLSRVVDTIDAPAKLSVTYDGGYAMSCTLSRKR